MTTHPLSRRQLVLTMFGVLLSMFLASLDQTVVGTAMPRIISDLGGFSHYTWVTTAYLISSTVAMPVSGKLIDTFGRKSLYVAGTIIFLAGSLLCGLSNSMAEIIVWRGLQGIGAGVLMANSFTVIGDLFPPVERGKYQGIMSGTFGLSSIIGPGLGGFLTDNLSWHWVFYINIPLGMFVLFVFLFLFPDIGRGDGRGRVDYLGAATLTIAVVMAMLALSWGGVTYPWGSATILSMFAASVAAGLLFVRIELRTPHAIIPMSLFKNGIVVVTLMVVFTSAFGMFATFVFIPLFFQGVLGLSATASGSFLTPMLLGMVAGSIVSGQALSRANGHYRIQGMIGLGLTAIGVWLLSRMTVETPYGGAVAYMVITGAGLGTSMPVYVIAIQNAVPHNVIGVVTSSTAFVRSIGASIGLAIFGSIMNNRFTSELSGGLPGALKASLPESTVEFVARNPQALMNSEVRAQMQGVFAQSGSQGTVLFEQALRVMRDALSAALSDVFVIAFLSIVLAFGINFFIKEIPLRKTH
ncbi:MAG: MFS transporter [Chloroflexi bacterium]|nr:MFS transporter [Chloroflexota bacterium]